MRHQQRGFSRSERVNDQIQRDLSEIIAREVKDPRLAFGLVTLTAVEVTPDYAHAKVFFTTLADKGNIDDVLYGLNKSAPFMRALLGKRLKIHTIPELHFHYDASVERGVALSNLIDQANSVRAKE